MFVTRNVFLKFKCQAPADGEGNDLPGDGGTESGKGEPEPAKKEDGEGGEGGEGDKAGAKKPSDEEARLLKENMKRKADNKALQSELDALKASVAGLDLNEVKALLAERKSAEEKQLEAKGDYDRLKQRMADEHKATMDAATARITELQTFLNQRESTINELTVGAKFANSTFIHDELTEGTGKKARQLFGSHFDVVDGQTIGYDKPRGEKGRTALVDGYGNNLEFDAAMKKIVDADPDSESLYRSKIKAGAGSSTKPATKVPDVNTGAPALSRIAAGLKGLSIS